MKGQNKLTLIEILANSPFMGEIVNKVDQLAKLNRKVAQTLDPELKKHCKVANLREGILILTTTSAAFGHKIRFIEMDLLSAIRAEPEWCHIKSIKTQVRPSRPPLQKSFSSAKMALSYPAAYGIKSIAQDITTPALKEALLRLSSHFSSA